jgi:hypothetical protein
MTTRAGDTPAGRCAESGMPSPILLRHLSQESASPAAAADTPVLSGPWSCLLAVGVGRTLGRSGSGVVAEEEMVSDAPAPLVPRASRQGARHGVFLSAPGPEGAGGEVLVGKEGFALCAASLNSSFQGNTPKVHMRRGMLIPSED